MQQSLQESIVSNLNLVLRPCAGGGSMKNAHRRIRLRQPEGTAAIRHGCMDKTKDDKYFDVLKSVIEKSELWDKPKVQRSCCHVSCGRRSDCSQAE